MNKMLTKLGYDFHSSADHELVREIKEKLCYVALDYETELKNTSHSGDAYNRTYELPDGETLTIGPERFQCPEAIFKPALIGKELPGLHEMCF
jgi:actin